MIRDMEAADHLPDYHLSLDERDLVHLTRRSVEVLEGEMPFLSPDVHDAARAIAPGWDVYALERDWQTFWMRSGRPRLRAPDRAFLAFVRARMVRQTGGDDED